MRYRDVPLVSADYELAIIDNHLRSITRIPPVSEQVGFGGKQSGPQDQELNLRRTLRQNAVKSRRTLLRC
jgi:hypothetical protein